MREQIKFKREMKAFIEAFKTIQTFSMEIADEVDSDIERLQYAINLHYVGEARISLDNPKHFL